MFSDNSSKYDLHMHSCFLLYDTMGINYFDLNMDEFKTTNVRDMPCIYALRKLRIRTLLDIKIYTFLKQECLNVDANPVKMRNKFHN